MLFRSSFNAVAGAGRGKYSDCGQTEQPIVCINGVCKPNMLLESGDCLWIKTAGDVNPLTNKFMPTRPESGASLIQEIRSNCPACCKCSDYVVTGQYMNAVRDVYKGIGDGAHSVLVQHSENITRWIDQQTCRQRQPIKQIGRAHV